jgi:hypothetical protein
LRIVTHPQQTFRFAACAALFLLAACASTPQASAPANPAQTVHKSCEQTCNSEYDTCMDRFTGMGAGGGPGLGRHEDDANADLARTTSAPIS